MYDYKLALATGVDIPIPACQIAIHQPTIKEISYIGEKEYFFGIQCITIKEVENVTAFQVFMALMQDPKAVNQKSAILSALDILFPGYTINVTPRSLLLNREKENIIIDENNFSSLQETLRHIGCLAGKEEKAFNPSNEAAAKIAQKLQKGRDVVAAEHQSQNNPNDASILGQYMSILAIGLGKSMEELINLTVYQLYDLLERFGLYEQFDLDIRQRLAGGKPDSQPDNWKKIIH